MNPTYLLYLSSLIYASSYYFYIKDSIKGKTKPNRMAFIFWSLTAVIALASQLSQGIGIEALLTFFIALMPIAVLFISFTNKKAYWKTTKFDLVCGAFALIGLILWKITGVGNIAILFSIMVDILAALPVIVKVYHHPETESSLAYLGCAISVIFTLLAVETFSFASVAYAINVMAINLLIYALIIIKFRLKSASP